jgi:hypothetical protein
MSRSNRTGRLFEFAKNERAWADFFITRIGLILFAAHGTGEEKNRETATDHGNNGVEFTNFNNLI